MNMYRIVPVLLLVFLLSLPALAQKEVLLEIGGTEITKQEFERIYKKNNNNLYDEKDKKSPQEYLDLFINYKLKVLEARNLKLDTNQVFVNEIEGYRKELAAPYLTDMQFNDQLVKELYHRMSKEVNASHILLRVDKNAEFDVAEKVKKRALAIRKEILNGKDFGEAAIEFSEDPSAKSNKGNLSYFTAFQMVAPFEDAAFQTPIGEISQPVRSSFGFHLIKVHDIRDNQGEIKVAHIMKVIPKNATPEQKEKVKNEIFNLYIELQNGADFTELAKTKSDDKQSAANGGEMPWFSAGRIIKEISVPSFALKNIGDYTTPVESRFGYHIIKKLDHRGIKPFEELKGEIENRIKRDPERSTGSKQSFIQKLKREYNFSEHDQGLEMLKQKSEHTAEIPANTLLFNLNAEKYTFRQLEEYVNAKEPGAVVTFGNYSAWVEHEIIQYEESRLEEKHPEFKYLFQEYYEGILLFNISEQMVWNKASEDTIGLESFYEKNKDNHVWDERFKGLKIVCTDSETRDEAEKYFGENLPVEEIIDLINKNEQRIEITENAWTKGSDPVIDYYIWNQSKPDSLNERLTFVRGDLVKDEPKSLDEARGLFISDYQEHLEKEWVKNLRKKYKIDVHKKVLKSIESV